MPNGRENCSDLIPRVSKNNAKLSVIYINKDNIEYISMKSDIIAYIFADDCLLYREINNQSDTETLQQDLDNLQHREKAWLMEIQRKMPNPANHEKVQAQHHHARLHHPWLIPCRQHKRGIPGRYPSRKTLLRTAHQQHNQDDLHPRHFLQRNLRGCSKDSKIPATGHL